MKIIFLTLSLMSSAYLLAQAPKSWNGYFEGNMLGIHASLKSISSANTWTATVDAGGYLFKLEGTMNGDLGTGTMTDVQTQTNVPYDASILVDRITFSINDINPATGIKEKMDFTFIRATEPTSVSSGPTGKINSSESLPTNLDQTLVGNWRYTESYVSGEFSFATDWFMQMNKDGTFSYTEGRSAGGGPNSSLDSGSGKTDHGNWKTENKSIYVNGGNGWVFFAKYYKENNYLMLTLQNGKKQVWEKI